ncbi:Coagulation factor XI [Brachionus plicatilis]|uniref:Coagulation factor XI n=1 Tax=Brachionus plicatilis TaxID=10195 RepID=A0A3M7RUU9_BRAPC|nr:Coagulation factor XI [Brachionus plicatilis]
MHDSSRLHPNYNSTNYNNDIALFKLQTRAEFSSTVGTICLPNEFVANVGKRAVVIGWGKISIQGIFPSKLQETFVEIKNNSECSFYNLQKTQLCAGISVGDIKDSCQGDSGSPMFINDNGRYYLAGIVSYGRSKCDGFGVYTNVFEYLSWIKKTMKYN